VSPEKYKQFLAKLEATPEPNARLRRTMKAAPPWREA